jgi:hypothetical protein
MTSPRDLGRLAVLLIAVTAWGLRAQTMPAELPPLVGPDGGLGAPWRVLGYPKSHREIPPTRFVAGARDGMPGVQVIADRSYGTLALSLPPTPPLPLHPLQWRWRIEQPLALGADAPDLFQKAGDDAALKVCAMFDHPIERVPFFERQVLRLARNAAGEPLPAATVCYVWDQRHAAGTEGENPYSRRVRFVVLRGRDDPRGQWVSEQRDLARDFLRLFGDEHPAGQPVPALTQIVIGADADNTASRSEGWVAGVRWAQ